MAININDNACSGCGICVNACPVSAISLKEGKAVIDEKCIECQACISQCPNNALSA